MKKLSVILTSILIMLLLLVGCGSSDIAEEPQAEEQVPETHYTEHQTEIANLNNNQSAFVNNGWLYSNGIQNDTYGFYKRRIDNSEITLLRGDVDAQCVTVNGEYIYAVLRDYDTGHIGVYRYRLGGDDEKELVPNAATLQVVGDAMYYCKCKEDDFNEYTQYCKSSLDGENEEVIIDKPVFFPYIIDNTVFYQDDADNETIHKLNLETKEDTKITQEKTYGYTLDDDYMYCIVNDGSTRDHDDTGTLVKVNLESLESTVIYDGVSVMGGLAVNDNTLYFANNNDEGRLYSIEKDGSNIGIITQDNHTQCAIVVGDMLYYVNCDSDNYIDGFVMCKLDGSDKFDL